MADSVHYIQSMSAYKAISLKKQQKSKYNLCKHQFRGNLKIKISWISSKRHVGIESNLSQKILLSFLNHKPLSELLKTFSSIHCLLQLRVNRLNKKVAFLFFPPTHIYLLTLCEKCFLTLHKKKFESKISNIFLSVAKDYLKKSRYISTNLFGQCLSAKYKTIIFRLIFSCFQSPVQLRN